MAATWIMKGNASSAMAKTEEAEAAKRKEEQGKMWRFFLKDKEEAKITFVDGDLCGEGYLQPPRYYEHNIQQGGKYGNLFVCPEKTHPESGEKCPLCEQGDRPSLVALFTVVDHRQFQRKDGTVGQDTVKILAAKPITFELLNKIAVKRKGLAGATFDVSRIGDKAAAVGSMFDFVEKNDVEALKKVYLREFKDPKTGKVTTKCVFVPADYENEIVYRDEATLRQMGFGKGMTTGSSPMGQQKPNTEEATTYDEHL